MNKIDGEPVCYTNYKVVLAKTAHMQRSTVTRHCIHLNRKIEKFLQLSTDFRIDIDVIHERVLPIK